MKQNPDTTKIRPVLRGIYTALLTQSGTTAPVVIELNNTLGVEVVWTRVTTGMYKATSSEEIFTLEKTIITLLSGIDGIYLSANGGTDNEMTITTQNEAGANTDGLLDHAGVEIRVYN